MIKFAVAALWIVAATIGSIYVAFSATGSDKHATEQGDKLAKLDFLKSDMMSIPVVSDGAVKGYFLTKLVYSIEPEKLKTLKLPVQVLITDELYSYLFSNPQIDFSKVKTLNLDAMRNGLRDSINAKVGDMLVHDVLVEQIDYLSKEQIRDNALRRRDYQLGGTNRPTLR